VRDGRAIETKETMEEFHSDGLRCYTFSTGDASSDSSDYFVSLSSCSCTSTGGVLKDWGWGVKAN
jgi:hypothetical protein